MTQVGSLNEGVEDQRCATGEMFPILSMLRITTGAEYGTRREAEGCVCRTRDSG